VKALVARTGRALGIFVPVVLVSSFVTYGLGALSNSNPAATILGDNADPASIARMNRALGFDRPIVVQYWHWLIGSLHGNFGRSYFSQIPVSQSISQRLPVDLSIAAAAVVLAVIFGTAGGVLAATHRGSWIDRTVTAVCSIASTLPPFVIGIGLVILFATTFKLLPSSGYVGPTTNPLDWLEHIVLPGIALSFEPAVGIARQLRTAMVEVLDQNYIVGAEVRGLPRRRILIFHALRNAAGPALTVVGIAVPLLIGGAVVAEGVFALPGLGQLALESASQRDVPPLQGVLLVTSGFVIVANLLVNTTVGWLQPTRGR
jgi:peptide/nickel transport system permease protein